MNYLYKRKFSAVFPGFLYIYLLVTSPSVLAQKFEVKEFQIPNQSILDQSEVTEILEPFTGQHDGLEGLYAAKDALEKSLSEQGFAFYRAVLPTQTLKDGIVYFELVQFKVDSINVKGHQHFSTDNILSQVPLQVGESPNTQRLASMLALANENPAKSVKLNFSAGKEPQTISAVINVEDENPQSVYAQINNTGSDEDARYRLSLGYQNNNLFDLDHSFTLTYTTAPEEAQKVKQWGINYRIPIYSLSAFLDFLLSDSTIDSGEVADDFVVQGKGSVVSVSFTRLLMSKGIYSHRWIASLSQKKFDDEIFALGNPIGTDITSQPFALRYQGSWSNTGYRTAFYIGISANIEGGNNNEDTDYAAKRVGADASWNTVNFGLNYIKKFSFGHLVSLNLNALSSSDALISGEQFGIGGANSVRGYDERILLGDSGQSLSLEYWGAPFTEQNLRWLVFADIGKVTRNEVQVGEQASSEISGYGLGLRWNYKKSSSLKLDLARANEDFQSVSAGDSRLHLSLYFRF